MLGIALAALLLGGPAQDSDAKLLKAVQDGDVKAAFEGLKESFAAAGAPVDPILRLNVQPFDVPLSSYVGYSCVITISDMIREGQGHAYWEAWSKEATGEKWQVAKSFKDEADMRLTGNYAVLGILAHEIGHHLADQYRVDPSDRGLAELIADRIAVAMMLHLDRNPELKRLRGRYVDATINDFRNAIPDGVRIDIPADQDLDAWCAANQPRSEIGPYVSLQLARQKRLLTDPASASLETLCLKALKEAHLRKAGAIPAWKGRVEARSVRKLPADFRHFQEKLNAALTSSRPTGTPTYLTFDGTGRLRCTLALPGGIAFGIEKESGLERSKPYNLAELLKGTPAASVDLMFAAAVLSPDEGWAMVGTFLDDDPTYLLRLDQGAVRLDRTFKPGVERAMLSVSPSGVLGLAWAGFDGIVHFSRRQKGLWSADSKPAIRPPMEIAIDDQGRLFFQPGGGGIQVLEDGVVRSVVGGLKAWRDGPDPALFSPGAMQVVGDELLILDMRVEAVETREVSSPYLRAIRLIPDR